MQSIKSSLILVFVFSINSTWAGILNSSQDWQIYNNIKSTGNIKRAKGLVDSRIEKLLRASGIRVSASRAMSTIAASSNTKVASIVSNYLKKQTKSVKGSPTEKFLKPLISKGQQTAGFSQLVLDIAHYCRATNIRDYCIAAKKLTGTTLNYIYNDLPGRGKRITSVAAYHKGDVQSGRGLVGTRAFVPLYRARRLTWKYWSSDEKKWFKNKTLALRREFDGSVRDFLIKIVNNFQKNSHKDLSKIISSINGASSITQALERCEAWRNKLKGRVQKCTSNHVIVSLFGKLLTDSVRGFGLSRSTRRSYMKPAESNFKFLINNGILATRGKYIFSDYYRSSQKKNGVSERRGLTYMSMQAKFVVFAAEVLKNEGVVDLYQYNSKRLLLGINHLARMINYKIGYARNYYYTSNTNQGNAVVHIDEYRKYIEPIKESDKINKMRMFTFMDVVKDRICDNSLKQSAANVCKGKWHYNKYRHAFTYHVVVPKESEYLGPIGYLYN